METNLPYSWHESSIESKLTQIMEKLLEVQSEIAELRTGRSSEAERQPAKKWTRDNLKEWIEAKPSEAEQEKS